MSRRNSIVGNGPMLNRKASIAALQKSNSVQYDQMPAELMQIAVDIKTVDMDEDRKKFAVATVQTALTNHSSEREVAQYVRQTMDTEFGNFWNVVVGRQFGSDVTHIAKQYIQLQYGPIHVLIWKSR